MPQPTPIVYDMASIAKRLKEIEAEGRSTVQPFRLPDGVVLVKSISSVPRLSLERAILVLTISGNRLQVTRSRYGDDLSSDFGRRLVRLLMAHFTIRLTSDHELVMSPSDMRQLEEMIM